MERHNTISIKNAILRTKDIQFKTPVSLDIKSNEQVALVGLNSSGKSILVDLITGKYPLQKGTISYDFTPSSFKEVYKNIKYIAFRDSYGNDDASHYYQQRWNNTDNDCIPTVRECLSNLVDEGLKEQLIHFFSLEHVLDKSLMLLSSGEMRKYQLIKALLYKPRVLILDNPFIGLDSATRLQLVQLLTELADSDKLQLIIVTSILDEIPEFITHVIPIEHLEVGKKLTRTEYLRDLRLVGQALSENINSYSQYLIEMLRDLPQKESTFADEVVRMDHVLIQYGERVILKDLNWVVKKGDRWSLTGVNGSGKSTLLSLICADNPQSYARGITLFGKKRGSGESIWDIKKHIGYVSPEMHRFYQKNIPAIFIVASGLFDSIGIYQQIKPESLKICEWWMKIFGIFDLKDRLFLKLSSGEQRLVLLARAFVKNPELLILDEPLHGLDSFNRMKVKKIIEIYGQLSNKTLIMVTHYENDLPPIFNLNLHLEKQT